MALSGHARTVRSSGGRALLKGPVAAVLTVVAALGCAGPPEPVPAAVARGLRDVNSWAIQLSGLEAPGAVERLARADVDLVVLDPTQNVRGREGYPIAAVVDQLHAHPGQTRARKLVLAYLNVGEAESYRTYWSEDWIAPTDNRPGTPPFLLARDPDGWPGNYPVAFWRPPWRRIIERELDDIVDAGFDGIFLDWIAGWQDTRVTESAALEGLRPAAAMTSLLHELRDRVLSRRPSFRLAGLNAAGLIEVAPHAAASLDAVVQEPLSFAGAANVAWDDPAASDRLVPASGDWSTATLVRRLEICRNAGLTVLTLDYASVPANVRRAEDLAREHGFVPCVTRSTLDRLPAAVPLQH